MNESCSERTNDQLSVDLITPVCMDPITTDGEISNTDSITGYRTRSKDVSKNIPSVTNDSILYPSRSFETPRFGGYYTPRPRGYDTPRPKEGSLLWRSFATPHRKIPRKRKISDDDDYKTSVKQPHLDPGEDSIVYHTRSNDKAALIHDLLTRNPNKFSDRISNTEDSVTFNCDPGVVETKSVRSRRNSLLPVHASTCDNSLNTEINLCENKISSDPSLLTRLRSRTRNISECSSGKEVEPDTSVPIKSSRSKSSKLIKNDEKKLSISPIRKSTRIRAKRLNKLSPEYEFNRKTKTHNISKNRTKKVDEDIIKPLSILNRSSKTDIKSTVLRSYKNQTNDPVVESQIVSYVFQGYTSDLILSTDTPYYCVGRRNEFYDIKNIADVKEIPSFSIVPRRKKRQTPEIIGYENNTNNERVQQSEATDCDIKCSHSSIFSVHNKLTHNCKIVQDQVTINNKFDVEHKTRIILRVNGSKTSSTLHNFSHEMSTADTNYGQFKNIPYKFSIIKNVSHNDNVPEQKFNCLKKSESDDVIMKDGKTFSSPRRNNSLTVNKSQIKGGIINKTKSKFDRERSINSKLLEPESDQNKHCDSDLLLSKIKPSAIIQKPVEIAENYKNSDVSNNVCSRPDPGLNACEISENHGPNVDEEDFDSDLDIMIGFDGFEDHQFQTDENNGLIPGCVIASNMHNRIERNDEDKKSHTDWNVFPKFSPNGKWTTEDQIQTHLRNTNMISDEEGLNCIEKNESTVSNKSFPNLKEDIILENKNGNSENENVEGMNFPNTDNDVKTDYGSDVQSNIDQFNVVKNEPVLENEPNIIEKVAITNGSIDSAKRNAFKLAVLASLNEEKLLYAARNAVHETEERKRKKWDIQRIRELRRVEMLKERMQNRKAGNNTSNVTKKKDVQQIKRLPPTSFCPSIENLNYVKISYTLPIYVFGSNIPATKKDLEKVYTLPWEPKELHKSKMLEVQNSPIANSENRVNPIKIIRMRRPKIQKDSNTHNNSQPDPYKMQELTDVNRKSKHLRRRQQRQIDRYLRANRISGSSNNNYAAASAENKGSVKIRVFKSKSKKTIECSVVDNGDTSLSQEVTIPKSENSVSGFLDNSNRIDRQITNVTENSLELFQNDCIGFPDDVLNSVNLQNGELSYNSKISEINSESVTDNNNIEKSQNVKPDIPMYFILNKKSPANNPDAKILSMSLRRRIDDNGTLKSPNGSKIRDDIRQEESNDIHKFQQSKEMESDGSKNISDSKNIDSEITLESKTKEVQSSKRNISRDKSGRFRKLSDGKADAGVKINHVRWSEGTIDNKKTDITPYSKLFPDKNICLGNTAAATPARYSFTKRNFEKRYSERILAIMASPRRETRSFVKQELIKKQLLDSQTKESKSATLEGLLKSDSNNWPSNCQNIQFPAVRFNHEENLKDVREDNKPLSDPERPDEGLMSLKNDCKHLIDDDSGKNTQSELIGKGEINIVGNERTVAELSHENDGSKFGEIATTMESSLIDDDVKNKNSDEISLKTDPDLNRLKNVPSMERSNLKEQKTNNIGSNDTDKIDQLPEDNGGKYETRAVTPEMKVVEDRILSDNIKNVFGENRRLSEDEIGWGKIGTTEIDPPNQLRDKIANDNTEIETFEEFTSDSKINHPKATEKFADHSELLENQESCNENRLKIDINDLNQKSILLSSGTASLSTTDDDKVVNSESLVNTDCEENKSELIVRISDVLENKIGQENQKSESIGNDEVFTTSNCSENSSQLNIETVAISVPDQLNSIPVENGNDGEVNTNLENSHISDSSNLDIIGSDITENSDILPKHDDDVVSHIDNNSRYPLRDRTSDTLCMNNEALQIHPLSDILHGGDNIRYPLRDRIVPDGLPTVKKRKLSNSFTVSSSNNTPVDSDSSTKDTFPDSTDLMLETNLLKQRTNYCDSIIEVDTVLDQMNNWKDVKISNQSSVERGGGADCCVKFLARSPIEKYNNNKIIIDEEENKKNINKNDEVETRILRNKKYLENSISRSTRYLTRTLVKKNLLEDKLKCKVKIKKGRKKTNA